MNHKTSARKVCIIEANEIAPRVWKDFCAMHPDSTISRLFEEGKAYTTVADDVETEFLYPSQTWASLNTGMAYSQHGIHWYNDPKPDPENFWWHAAALAGKRVGLVNVLHTSPMQRLVAKADYAFLLPDCFSVDAQTLPSRFEAFQALNIHLAQKNGRSSSSNMGTLGELAIRSIARPTDFGLSPFTLAECVRALPGVLKSRERLRNLQFPPLASIFFDLLRKHQPDIAVLFTNHVAAAQHRYWHALFPQDYAKPLYDQAWQQRYQNEIRDGMQLLDRFLSPLAAFCLKNGYILAVVTSMGQQANRKLTPDYVRDSTHDYRISDPERFIEALIGSGKAQFRRAMVPQYTYDFATTENAEKGAVRLQQFIGANAALSGSRIDSNDSVLTFSLSVKGHPASFQLDGVVVALEQLGIEALEVDDHHSGCHHPDGQLLIWNDRRDELFSVASTPERFSYLEYANELRTYFGLPDRSMQGALISHAAGSNLHGLLM